jgi:hypothetical protein
MKEYKIHLEIEEVDEDNDTYKTVQSDCLTSFDTIEEAEAFFYDLQSYGD